MPTKEKERDSNFELLRIVAISGVIIHHFLIALNLLDYRHGKLCGGEALNSIIIIGVNCFILISGYFGIRFQLEKIFRFGFLILFIIGIDWILGNIWPSFFNFQYASQTIIPFQKGSNWFISSYFALMFLAPFLNKAIEHLNPKEKIHTTFLFACPILLAYIFNTQCINANGYNCLHLVFIYLVGTCLREVTVSRVEAFLGFISGVFITYIVANLFKSGYTAYAYNSPQVLLSSISAFLFFKTLKIHSKAINRLAQCVFTIFLLHYIVLQYIHSMNSNIIKQEIPKLFIIYLGIWGCGIITNELYSKIYSFFSNKVKKLKVPFLSSRMQKHE